MRLASIATDYWELESGEDRHEANPESFQIPPRSDREHLRIGQHVKLLFQIEGEEDDGSVGVQVERSYLPGWRPTDGGVSLLNPTTIPITRYRYRGARIPSPWAHLIEEGPAA